MAKPRGAPYVAEIKKRYKNTTYTYYLLRCSYREGGKVHQQTLANLSHLPPEAIALLRASLRGEKFVPDAKAIEIVATRRHGDVASVGAMVSRLGLDRLISAEPCAEADLVLAMIVARVVEPHTKLATTRWWANTSLVANETVERATEDDLYAAMDWLVPRQSRIEQGLARRHLREGGLVLYDLSSSYVEGTHCPLAAFGHNRDGKSGKKQINYGLLLDAEGRPISVQVYAGNVGDPATVADQCEKLQKTYRLSHVVLAGDRGMLTSARIREIRGLGGIDWISCLRSADIQALAASGVVAPSMFDQRDLVEITAPEFPGERLVVCYNPLLAADRERTRNELLDVAHGRLEAIARRVEAKRLKEKAKIAAAVARCLSRSKVAKHFTCVVGEGVFTFQRDQARIAAEAALDGIYVVRTSVPASSLPPGEVVTSYKSLSRAEQAFRTLKSLDLRIRPLHHWAERRVRAHIFLCMLAYYVEWHLRQAWAPYLFEDEHPGRHEGGSPVAPALRSPEALAKARTQRTEDGETVHSFRTLIDHLSTIARNQVRFPAHPELAPFHVPTTPDRLQRELCRLVGLEVDDDRRQKTKA